jgi:hypothetical protein
MACLSALHEHQATPRRGLRRRARANGNDLPATGRDTRGREGQEAL